MRLQTFIIIIIVALVSLALVTIASGENSSAIYKINVPLPVQVKETKRSSWPHQATAREIVEINAKSAIVARKNYFNNSIKSSCKTVGRKKLAGRYVCRLRGKGLPRWARSATVRTTRWGDYSVVLSLRGKKVVFYP